MNEKIEGKLKELVDIKYQKFHSQLCPGIDNILGIRVPILRSYAKELKKEYSVDYLLGEINSVYYEEIMLQGMLIGLDHKVELSVFLDRIKCFVPKIDNWAVCDVFCAGLKKTNENLEEMWVFLKSYLESTEEFQIRFAVVMLLDYYIIDVYIEDVLTILGKIQNDAYYVKMAVAWAISLCFIRYYDKTKEFMKHSTIDDFTYNKALQKTRESYRVSAERKEELQKMKR